MSIIDNRTTRLSLPLPNTQNNMTDDCARLIAALNSLDGVVALSTDLNSYTTTTLMNQALALKADSFAMTQALFLKADASALASKADSAGSTANVFNVAPAVNDGHAVQKSQFDAHKNATGFGAHGATSGLSPSQLMMRDSNGDVAARNFMGALFGNADSASLTQNIALVDEAINLLYGSMGGSDFFRLLIGGGQDNGYVEIATADNGNEPIYVRQYTGGFTAIARSLCLLDANGNTTIPNDFYLYGGIRWLEYGNNAAGEYYRFADGTLICTGSVSASNQAPISHAFAANFVAPPLFTISNDAGGAQSVSGQNITATSFSFVSSTIHDTVKTHAIGRWK